MRERSLMVIAAHPDVHAIVYLGLGIQSNQARMMREGRFYPDHGLERIVAYHERQDERFAERQSVSDYAAALDITPVHLTRIARAATGKPASRLIEERLVREARRNLIYTNLSVATIAYTLGFSDPAYFSRIFTRCTGLAPRRFRERVLRER